MRRHGSLWSDGNTVYTMLLKAVWRLASSEHLLVMYACYLCSQIQRLFSFVVVWCQLCVDVVVDNLLIAKARQILWANYVMVMIVMSRILPWSGRLTFVNLCFYGWQAVHCAVYSNKTHACLLFNWFYTNSHCRCECSYRHQVNNHQTEITSEYFNTHILIYIYLYSFIFTCMVIIINLTTRYVMRNFTEQS